MSGAFTAYRAIVGAQIRSQLSYPASFALSCLAAFIGAAIDLVAILVLFTQVQTIAGFTRPEVLLLYGLAKISMTVADLVAGQVEKLSMLVRTGALDAFLVRPLSTLGQVFASDVALRRLAGTAVGLLAYGYALATCPIDWTVARIAMACLSPIIGAVIFGSFFVAACSINFWVIEASELPNTITYGTSSMAAYPVPIYGTLMRRLFCFIVPSAWVAYFPALALLGRPDPLELPEFLQWSSPVAAVLCVLVAGAIWRAGIRQYRSTGS